MMFRGIAINVLCPQAKSRVMPHSLYTLLPVVCGPLEDISMNFIL